MTYGTREGDETLLKFTSGEVTIVLQGSEDFVERQVRFFRHYLEGAAKNGAGAATASAPATTTLTASAPTNGADDSGSRLTSFFKARASRAGRGAIQESLLLFGYFLQEVDGQPEFSIEQLGGCFGVVGRPQPKNLHHAVGTLKRKQKWFQEGSRRGSYRLSERGRKLVRPVSC